MLFDEKFAFTICFTSYWCVPVGGSVYGMMVCVCIPGAVGHLHTTALALFSSTLRTRAVTGTGSTLTQANTSSITVTA